MPKDKTDQVYTEMIQSPSAAEALAWLQEAKDPEARTISGGDGSETAWNAVRAIHIVKELYALGAVQVTAVEIEADAVDEADVEPEVYQDTSTLIVELPQDTAKRALLFAWKAGFAYGTGWDPEIDNGQKYLLVWRD